MKSQKNRTRLIVSLAAISLVTGGLFLTKGYFNNSTAGDDSAIVKVTTQPAGMAADLDTKREQRRERVANLAGYSDEATGESVKIAMDHAVRRAEDGRNEIVALDPIATPETLKERLAAIVAPHGVSPVAYADGADRDVSGMVIITSEIRAKIPREQAERLASEHGLKIVDFPSYAPDWVIFEAADPIDALEKIGGVRDEALVASADVLVARQYVNMVMPNDTLIGDQWHLKESNGAVAGTDIDVEDAWNFGGTGGVRGTGINIAVIDSGIQTNHPDFVGNINLTIDRDFVSSDDDPSPVFADENHATAVAGVAAARGNNNLGVSGAAPAATIIGHRLIAGVQISDRQISDALAYRTDVIQIKNNSWGNTTPFYKISPLIADALRTSATSGRGGKGTIYTFSAGNSGDEEDSANYSELTSSIYTIAVGATNSLGRRAYYSEPGANLVITAPSGRARDSAAGALGITTTDRTGADGYGAGDYTATFNGTSSSCPVVSGVIALMLEKNPNLGWRDVQEILIRTADKFSPAEPGWKTNAAGLHFNNDYGAGLIDATDAVNMAATWTNLAPQTSVVASRNNLGVRIPNNASSGTIVEFQLPTSNLVTEHVTLKLNIDHSARGELEIFLTSPSGTISELATRRSDLGNGYDEYTFSTVHNWAENSSGVWSLKIADRSNATNTTGGVINSAVLTVFGVVAPPVNPAPVVQIVNPQNNSVFSPGIGYNVEVKVSDFDIDGEVDIVKNVELFENDVLVQTLTSAPFIFPRNPANGTYTYVAKSTDQDDKVGSSTAILVTVKNQTPVIHTAVLNVSGQAYDDEPVIVSPVDATDAEMETITLAYQWEFSTDEVLYVPAVTQNTNTLTPSPTNSGKIWRCRITATDGNSTSEPFYTQKVNLLDRPPIDVVPAGSSYTYQSGLVLKGDILELSRRAIIHEFSQGFPGGTSEWIEILKIQAGTLAKWSILDADSNSLVFTDSPVWETIPAGTLIVIYNGDTGKDPVIPADTVDFASGKMIISSKNETYFVQTPDQPSWPGFSNLGDAIFLNDGTDTTVHEISYGNSFVARPNVGQVISGSAAYFVGETEVGASTAGEWTVTTATVGRTSTTGFGNFSLFPEVVLTNGRYSQDFNVDPGDNGIFFPNGWSAYTVNFGQTQTTNVDEMRNFQGATAAGGVFNFGSKIGMYGGNRSFDPGFIALGIDNTQGVTGLQVSYDLIKISEQLRSMDMQLQYTVGNPGNTNTIWTNIAGGSHRSGSTPNGTVDRFVNIPLPAIFENRISPIYLRWYYSTAGNNTGAGGRDAIAIDNVIISSNQSPNILLSLVLNPTTVSETAGENASIGTMTLSQPLTEDLTVNIFSSDTSEATVPPSLVIPAGQVTATFPIKAVDDRFSDGPQAVAIKLTAVNFAEVSAILTVTDNEPKQIGVTPGFGNNTANSFFVQRLREGRINEPALFSLAAGSVLPDGLTLDATTGLISGTISPNASPGSYSVTIVLANIRFESTSQTIVINVSPTGSFTFSSWIALFDVSDASALADPDFDQLPNLVEYALNSFPGTFEQPSPVLVERSATEISLTFSREKNRDDVLLVVEWSTTLEAGSWQTTGITESTLEETTTRKKVKASLPIVPGDPARFMRLKATSIAAPN